MLVPGPRLIARFDGFERLVARVREKGIFRWEAVEPDFLAVVGEFDAEYASGRRDAGWYKAKARYFNDLIVALLENASKRPIALRSKRKSELFGQLDVDICYPAHGEPTIAGEVKQLGTPPHPGNKGMSRPASQDVHKRTREVALTSIDLKVAYAPPTPIRSFQEWIDRTPPGYFSFWCMRAASDSDFHRIRQTLVNLRTYCNGIGAVIYEPVSPAEQTRYQVRVVHELDMGRVLREMAQRIV